MRVGGINSALQKLGGVVHIFQDSRSISVVDRGTAVVNIDGVCKVLLREGGAIVDVGHLPLYGKRIIDSGSRIFQRILDHLIGHEKGNDGINGLHLILYGIIDLV